MCHILLAGYEDVPSFLNQWKLVERSYINNMKHIKFKNDFLVKTVYSVPTQNIQ